MQTVKLYLSQQPAIQGKSDPNRQNLLQKLSIDTQQSTWMEFLICLNDRDFAKAPNNNSLLLLKQAVLPQQLELLLHFCFSLLLSLHLFCFCYLLLYLQLLSSDTTSSLALCSCVQGLCGLNSKKKFCLERIVRA